MNPILDIKGLGRSFGSGATAVEAVKDVTFSLEAGIIFGFLGPNGAGKTTTLRMLTTLLTPTKGNATVLGYDLAQEPAEIRTKIGYVSQRGGCYRSATARENIVLQGRLYGMHKKQAEERATTLIALLDLSGFCDRAVETYSGGQARRVDIAMGMVHAPALLFLDEPTTGLDPQSRAYLWSLLKELRAREGMTIFLTTHYLDEADALCDRIAIMDHGMIIRDGSPAALKREISGDIITIGLETPDACERARQLLAPVAGVKEIHVQDEKISIHVESGEEELLAQLVSILHASSVRFKGIALKRPTLDDVFLRATGHSLREENRSAS
ncbi:MAG: ATP-binding cassette domain-containing protein [Candidatus Dependentiae bacterium]|nr:ATP-binding cassette domain-containing protein [Candidatus Dependentiae bacterium]